MEKGILLDGNDFEKLVSGKILQKDGVKIALQDIGYDLMHKIISNKQQELWKN